MNRAREWLTAGSSLTPHERSLVRATARLAVHLENLSNRLFHTGELTADGQPREALRMLLDYDQRIHQNLASLFDHDGDGDDLLSLVRGKG